MRIAVDLRFLETPTSKRGVGYFNRNIFENLLALPHQDIDFNLFTFPKSNLKKEIKIGIGDKFSSVPALFWPKKGLRKLDPFFSIFWQNTLKKIKPDLLHLPFIFDLYYLSVPDNIKTIITMYDLIPILFPKQYFQNKLAEDWYFQRLEQAKKAAKIITISKSSKKDIEHILKIPSEKIKVIYGGIDQRFKVIKKQKIEEVLKVYKIRGPYILTVSTHSFHKNISRIFQAFKEYIKEHEETFLVVVCKLIPSEKKDWLNQLKMLGIEKKVILTNFVKDDGLPAIYSGAEFLLFPSLYEGLGLPILEAQACGCPVITSNISSMPEVAGKGAILVDPYNINDIVKAMVKCQIPNTKLQMIRVGLKNIKRFSWKMAAKEVLEVYREVIP